MTEDRVVRRYPFSMGLRSTDSRLYPALMLVGAVVLLLAFPNWLGIVIMLPLVALGTYNLIRPMSDRWYVELEERELVIHFLGDTRIPYSWIAQAERRIPKGVMRLLAWFSIDISRLFGGRPADNPDTWVRLRFNGWVWCTIIPPIRVPRREWPLPMAEPEAFVADVNRRLTSSV